MIKKMADRVGAMTSLKELLAFNMKAQRRRLGITQAKLAERVGSSTHYVAMIELGHKSPSMEMLERLAAALEINPAALFSMQTLPSVSVQTLHKAVLTDIEAAVSQVIAERLKTLEGESGGTL
jgi:transcriptional regulator with XRE-family HTH domain